MATTGNTEEEEEENEGRGAPQIYEILGFFKSPFVKFLVFKGP